MTYFDPRQAVAECGVMLKQIDGLMARDLVDEASAMLDRVDELQDQIEAAGASKAFTAPEAAFIPRGAWRGGRSCF